MPSVTLGNTAPIEPRKLDESTTDIERVPRPDLGWTTTTFNVADHLGIGDALKLVADVYASHHSDAPPAWVESDDPIYAEALARQFDCPVGRPEDWEQGKNAVQPQSEPTVATSGDVQVAQSTPVASGVAVQEVTPDASAV